MKIAALIATACVLSATLHAQIPDFTPKTPLIGALLHNDAAEAKRLLQRDADPNEGRFVGLPPVLLAILRQDLDLLRLMVAKGADLDVRDRSGSTALMWAALNETGDASVVEELLRLGADPLASEQGRRNRARLGIAAGRHAGGGGSAKSRRFRDGGHESVGGKGDRTPTRERIAIQPVCLAAASCHHQSLPQMALGVARARGLQVDEPAARQQVNTTIAG